MSKKSSKRTSDKRKKEFEENFKVFEQRFGGFPAVHVLFDSIAELLIEKDMATELEIIKAVEKGMEQRTQSYSEIDANVKRKINTK